MAQVIVIGAGPMGLAAAYQALLDGHQVEVIEAAPEAGGMAAHFDFGGLSLERFYHFVCSSDQPTFDLLQELGIADKMRWVRTTMGFYYNGALHRWGDPISLLRLPGTPWLTKLRYGLFAFISMRRDTWPALEKQSARDWTTSWCGKRGFEQFWRPLLDLKFFEYADRISAAWIWTRIRRIGRSRESIMHERLGYIDGGSQTLVDALIHAIQRLGGTLRLGAPVQRVEVSDGSVSAVHLANQTIPAEFVISTVPIQHVARMVPDLPSDWKDKYAAIDNIGVCCVVFKLKRRLTPHFWVNINDNAHGIPGVIEFSNLRPLDSHIVYVPYYMPVTNPRFSWTDAQLIENSFQCLQLINGSFESDDIIDARVARLRYGQPICDVGFAAKIPPVQTPIRGLQIADTCYYYPEDRGIAESVRLGRAMARAVSEAPDARTSPVAPSYQEAQR